jgi:hypothetical protein
MRTELPKRKKPWKTHYTRCMRSKPLGSTAMLHDSIADVMTTSASFVPSPFWFATAESNRSVVGPTTS